MPTLASTHAWFNGEIGPRETGAPSIASINFHLGTGVFDGMMAYWNEGHYYIHRAEAHLQRFVQGAGRMGLVLPWALEDLLRGIEALLAAEPVGTQYVRPIAYRRSPELWVTGNRDRPVDVSIFTVRVERDSDAPISCHVSPVERISSRSIPAQTKVSGAYVNSFHARYSAECAGFEDGIMLDRSGHIAEASAANIFFIVGDTLITPALVPDIFPGITRQTVLDLARADRLRTVEATLSEQDIATVDGAFLCSTLMELRPLHRLGQRELHTREIPVFKILLASFRRHTHQ